jgi:hypothetical protein
MVDPNPHLDFVDDFKIDVKTRGEDSRQIDVEVEIPVPLILIHMHIKKENKIRSALNGLRRWVAKWIKKEF